ncbi:hypothetical protein [Glycocaulis sp.]|uniref:hypothetical protein n=1 Tax=Glycocaulis sp. TaxID=1969725 RepID=UPI003F71F573
MAKSPTTVDQLRHDIDRGRTHDKVDFPDPAAAPLGSDEEAAGTQVTPFEASQARHDETSRPASKAGAPGLEERNPRKANLFIVLGAGIAGTLALLALAT